jgi:hypothetical protein
VRLSGLVALLCCVGLLGSASGEERVHRARVAGIGPYRGLGAWVDIYDIDQMKHPWATVREAKSHGVRTIYLQTGNHTQKVPVVRPKRVARMISAAHSGGLKIVAWYLPSLKDLEQDLRRTVAAIRFETRNGQRFDGFALDIEADVVRGIAKRTGRMLRLSKRIHRKVGDSYALGAIIPAPLQMKQNPGYWGYDFPYQEVSEIYDIFLPMSYFGFFTEGPREAHNYITSSVNILRRETRDPGVLIHMIGGVADDATATETRGFVHSVRENGLLGASYYDYDTTGPGDWAELERVPTNPPQPNPLPARLGHPPLGNIPAIEETHPQEVFFKTSSRSGAATLAFQAFDAEPNEVAIWVNWRFLGTAAETTSDNWGFLEEIKVPSRLLHDTGRNFIGFTTVGRHTDWSTWGVDSVTLEPVAN